MHAMCDEDGNKNVDGALFGRVIIRAPPPSSAKGRKKKRYDFHRGMEFTRGGRSRMSANVYCVFGKLSKIHPSFCSRQKRPDSFYRARVFNSASYTRYVRRTKASDFYARGETVFAADAVRARANYHLAVSRYGIRTSIRKPRASAVVQLNSGRPIFAVRACVRASQFNEIFE